MKRLEGRKHSDDVLITKPSINIVVSESSLKKAEDVIQS